MKQQQRFEADLRLLAGRLHDQDRSADLLRAEILPLHDLRRRS